MDNKNTAYIGQVAFARLVGFTSSGFSQRLASMVLISTIALFCYLLPNIARAQCLDPVYDAGLFCNPDSINGAPIICSLECLDGFSASMPPDSPPGQPTSLCGISGIPDNLSWFAFVAGDTLVDLTITPSNCQPGSVFSGIPAESLVGIQAGIYSSCGFTEDDIVVCNPGNCSDITTEPLNLSSNEFIEGQVYYLFVDGCGGSVCDYVVTVNSAQQPFEVPEITTITNEFNFDLEVDTICQGAEVAFRLDSLDLDIEFNWSIDPPTLEYPSGIHPVTDTNTVHFVFSDEGVFDIIVYAFNDCDSNEPDTFQVIVAPLGDETFTDVTLCEECILEGVTLVAPDAGCIIGSGTPLILTEDPNGDGVPGWQGLSEVSSPGLQTNVVMNPLGCEYSQSVNIIEVPLKPREVVDLYFCFAEFPVSVDGVVFNNPGDDRNITIENGAVSGCDSLINITAHSIDLIGNASVGNCDDGMITIDFDIIQVEPNDYDSITYRWYDEFGVEILDFDNIDDELQVLIPGKYFVDVTVHKGTSDCSQIFGSFEVNANNLIPQTPTIAFAPNEVCINEVVAQIYLNNQGVGETNSWTFDPDLPFSMSSNSDTVFVSILTGEDFTYCVSAMNGCGESSQFCDNVIVSNVPSAEFMMPLEICVDSTLLVEYIGGDGTTSTSEFNWTFDGGTITNGSSPLSAGPFEIEYSTAGSYDVTMYLNESGCQSETEVMTVIVQEPFTIPNIECHSLVNAVAFSFDDTFIDGIEVVITSGQSFEIIGTDSIIIENLGSEEEVGIDIVFNDNHVCGGQISQSSCFTLPCPDVDFSIIMSNQGQCLDQDDSNIILDVVTTDGNMGEGEWISPYIINGNNFDVSLSGTGNHPISYEYIVSGCSFLIDTMVSIYGAPILDFEFEFIYCDEAVAQLFVETNGNSLFVDGDEVVDFENILVTTYGIHEIMITDIYGCSSVESINIEMLDIDESLIDGDLEIVLGEISTYETNDLGDLPNIAYTWILNGDIVCDDCTNVDISPEVSSELCMIASYADNCLQEVCVDIKVVEEIEIYVPNIFSPNGDGINDYFKFQSNSDGLMIESITVFDRWGELMFDSEGSINNEDAIMWDGTFNGALCSSGVYIYVIKYLDIKGEMTDKVGDVTLIR